MVSIWLYLGRARPYYIGISRAISAKLIILWTILPRTLLRVWHTEVVIVAAVLLEAADGESVVGELLTEVYARLEDTQMRSQSHALLFPLLAATRTTDDGVRILAILTVAAKFTKPVLHVGSTEQGLGFSLTVKFRATVKINGMVTLKFELEKWKAQKTTNFRTCFGNESLHTVTCIVIYINGATIVDDPFSKYYSCVAVHYHDIEEWVSPRQVTFI